MAEVTSSRELEQKLLERLGFPKRSPFGWPIPGTGEPKMPGDALTLDTAHPSQPYLVDRIPEEDDKLLKFLVESKIVPEQPIRIIEAAPYLGVLVVGTPDDKVSIGYNVARQIIIRPLP